MSIIANENIVARNIHGSCFLINISDNYLGDKCSLYEINETGMFIWKNINGTRTVDELAALLKEVIVDDIDYQTIRSDVADFIKTLAAKHFVEV